MISRRQLVQGAAATTILGLSRPLWAANPAGRFLKPGEYVWEPKLSPEGPIASVLISGADRQSYLLQDGEIVYQKPVTIADPGQTLGTHVLVLKTLEGKHPTWSAMPIRHAGSTTAMRPTDIATLDRIHFDPYFVEQALGSMHPGMSILVTDLAVDPKSRSDRDFVLVTSEFVRR